MAAPIILPATPADALEIARIYDHHVLHGTGTFEEAPPGPAEMARRIEAVLSRGWPWLVARGEGDGLLGYAYAGQYRDRSGYRYTCEDAIYVAAEAAGQGIGGALLAALIEAARGVGFTRMLAAIGDSANAASIALHARAGFVRVGLLDGVGVKFGRDLDVVFMQRSL